MWHHLLEAVIHSPCYLQEPILHSILYRKKTNKFNNYYLHNLNPWKNEIFADSEFFRSMKANKNFISFSTMTDNWLQLLNEVLLITFGWLVVLALTLYYISPRPVQRPLNILEATMILQFSKLFYLIIYLIVYLVLKRILVFKCFNVTVTWVTTMDICKFQVVISGWYASDARADLTSSHHYNLLSVTTTTAGWIMPSFYTDSSWLNTEISRLTITL